MNFTEVAILPKAKRDNQSLQRYSLAEEIKIALSNVVAGKKYLNCQQRF